MGEERVRLVVADDHSIWRTGMRADLGEAFWVVGDAADAAQAIELVAKVRPDVVAADLRMPEGGGIRVAAECAAICPVVILTVSEAEEDLLDAIAAGASGYLLKSSTTDELRAGLYRAAAGEPVFSAGLAALVLGDFSSAAKTPDGSAVRPLSPREREVLREVALGSTYREIGETLFISEKTVENHVRNILDKVRLRRRSELIRWAVKRGIDE
ncbi:MAG: response regulator transcription factor [Actinobacteria bacterium]|nr:response regulator transcription factor [Actinomycetota bacterium]